MKLNVAGENKEYKDGLTVKELICNSFSER